jgi:hypothetical protein
MAGSKSDRKINAKFDIFTNNEDANDSVRVGYIHPRRGYISGLTVYEANKYAETNPGTQFIIANRDQVRYININEVNKLKNKDTLPSSNPSGLVDDNGEFDPCNTVRGFRTDPDTLDEPEIKPNPDLPFTDEGKYKSKSSDGSGKKKKTGAEINYERYGSELDKCRTRIELQGGGGIGAVATPVVGLDGAILHVRMIHGGFGYNIPPQVRIIDDCKRGSGAKAKSILGRTGFITENFDDEADVEEYDFKLGQYGYDADDNPWGKVYAMSNQTVVGDWNPANVLSLTAKSGFETELQEYLAFLKGYDPNKPWWTTRDETPVRVTGNGKSKKANKLGGILYPVKHWAWGGDRTRDDLFEEVEFEVYGQGTYKNRQIYFQFEAEDGSHQFRVKGVTHQQRSGKRRTQLVSLKANTTYIVTSNVRKKAVDPGNRKLEQGLIEESGRNPREIGGQKAVGQKSKAIFADVVGSANDNDDIQVIANIGSFKAGERTGIKFDDSGIQNKQIRLKKSIDKIKARRLDIKKELATNMSNEKLKEEHGNLTVEYAEKLKQLRELRKKRREIDKNENNKFKRGTFDLTYRLNRRKEITFTEKVEPSFMNRYAVAPQYSSDEPGSDRAGKPYTLLYREYFPHDGEYVFRGSADNDGEVLLDNEKIMDITNTFNSKPVRVKKHVKEGLHDIRIDLLNRPKTKFVTETFTADGGDKTKYRTVKFNVVGRGSGRHRKISAVFTNKADSSDNFTINNDGENKEVKLVYRKVTADAKYDVKFIATADRFEKENKTQEFDITWIGINRANITGRNDIRGIQEFNRQIKLRDGDGNDTNATFRILSTDPGVEARFSDDGQKLIVKNATQKTQSVTLKLQWNDDPKTAGVAVRSIKIGDQVWKQTGEKGDDTKTLNITKKVPGSKDSYIEQGCVENGTKNKETRGSSNRIFADYIGSVNDNDDMQIFVKKGGIFTASNSRRTPGRREGGKGRNTFDLEYVFDEKTGGLATNLWQDLKDQDIVDDKTGKALQRDDIEKAQVFNTRQFIDKADRKLYRMRPDVGPFGDFFNRNGITPFNPLELDKEIPAVPPTVAPTPFVKPQAKFITRGGEVFLKVIGTGKATIGFKLKTDDNFVTSGVSAREVKISADGPDVLLKRTVVQSFRSYHPDGRDRGRIGRQGSGEIKEKEKIKGSGEFTAGREYKVTSIGGSPTSGFKPVDDTVVFDDDITNGLDNNGELFVDFVNPINPPKSQPPKPPKNGKNNPSNKNLDDVTGSCDDYAGIHKIVWKDIKFPASGTYTVDVQVDDNVRLEIFNRKFQAQTLDVKGFRGQGKSNGLQTFALEVEKGTYTIQAFLEQIPGKSIYAGNPMGLAVNIKAAYVTVQKEITVRQSWNQNPFGAALIIKAPPPPIPQEPVVKPDGPCPPNPIWTTRYPSEEQWHPVSHRAPNGRRTWSKFMNRYAMSPILPIGTRGSGYSGSQWSNTWTATIPYNGFYVFKGTVDNFADVTISQDSENSESLANLLEVVKKVDGFRTEKKDLTSNKFFLYKGEAKIDVTVRNGERIKYKQVTTKVFDTKDWITKPTDRPDKIGVDFLVFGQGSRENMGLKFIFKEIGGDDTFTIDNVTESISTETVKKRVKRNTDYKVTAIATGKYTKKPVTAPVSEKSYAIRTEGESRTAGRRVRNNGKEIQFDDNATNGFDENASLKIESTSPGVTAKFSDDAKQLIVKGDGEVSLKFSWDDNPGTSGLAVGTLKVGNGEKVSWTVRQRGEKGSERKTIKVGNTTTGTSRENINKSFRIKYNGLNSNNDPIDVSSNGRKIKLKDGGGSDTNAEITIEDVKGGTAKFSSDGRSIEARGNCSIRITLEWDDNPNTAGVALDSFEIGGKVWTRSGERGDKTQTINLDATRQSTPAPEVVSLIPEQGTLRSGSFGAAKKDGAKETPNQSDVIFADVIGSLNDNDDMQILCSKGIFTPSNKRKGIQGTARGGTQKRNTWDLTFRVDAAEESVEKITRIGEGFGKYDIKNQELSRSVTVGGRTPNRAPVIVNPTLATYRKGKLGPFLSPFFPLGTRESGSNLQGRTWEMVWENVEFPIAGDYKMEIEADDTLEVFIGENLKNSFGSEGYKSIGQTKVGKGVESFAFTLANPGKRDIKLILQNINIPGTTFKNNPTYAACKITCEIPIELADQRSWLVNPVGISAVLLAPPCSRQVGGIGTVAKVVVDEPGNSYPPSGTGTSGVPSQVGITSIPPQKQGVGYTPGDTVSVVGIATNLPITVGPFGKVTSVGIGTVPLNITTYPKIIITTSTGIGFVPGIETELRVDTPEVDPETVIQVTDLAGLKQTGYIEGRPYYGEVFFKDGTPFAGRYETAGRLIQVYATLQESIDAEVTTRPSAIQRSGTDINSNNPRLNIPGTPDNLV